MARTRPTQATDTTDGPTRLTGSDAFRLHATLTVGLLVCAGAFAFELDRALGGHTFSWMYVFEWPLFAGFALYMWWHLLHGTDRYRPAPPAAPAGTPAAGDGADPDAGTEDEDLAAWNAYLRRMAAEEAADSEPPRP